jgi:predicted Zn-dependent protease
VTTPPEQTSPIDRAAALLASDPARAEREARALAAASPRDPRPALILASALRRQGEAAAALAVLRPLARAYPNAAMTQFELGAALASNGDTRGAEAALRTAARLNRDHPEAWRALGELLFTAGDGKAAEAAFAQHRRAAVREPHLKGAAEAVCAGRLEEAELLLRRHLAAAPNDAAGLQMLAEVLIAQACFADAELLLERSLVLAPGRHGARFSLATALFQQQKAHPALGHMESLLAADPDDAAYRNLMAAILAHLGEFDRALGLYEGLLASYPRQPPLWLNYGHALRTVGRADAAIDAFRRCIALDPALGEAYLGLANLKVASFTPAETAAMRQVAARRDLRADDRAALGFALGKALEDAGDFAAAFAAYAAGAAARRSVTPYDAAAFTAETQASIALFTREFFAARAGFGADQPDPIFVVGLPRSGSTLIEQILASHSAIEGTMELSDIGFIAQQFGWSDPRPPAYPGAVADLTRARSAELGEHYLSATRIQRKLGLPFFIDKMPNNFQHIGLIQLILPNARIIDARRHPMATCFSAFKQHFARGQAFSDDLSDLGRYYRDYLALMAHFDAVLPGRVHRVIYEDMVEDTEGEVRRLLDHLGLPFEPACLSFYKSARAVRTVSSEQVRRPIFREGLDQWRNYEPWLGPLRQGLGDALETWRGSTAGA